MRYRYLTADVFTDQLFGGNPLAVLPDARGLDATQMQALAREFNLSETVFVLPPEAPEHSRRLRIFTPSAELPFAGHPTIGTALILAVIGEFSLDTPITTVRFEEGAGVVPVAIRVADGVPVAAQLEAPQAPEVRPVADPGRIAAGLSLEPGDLVTARGLPLATSCGMPFVLVELGDRAALGRARLDPAVWQPDVTGGWAEFPYLFTKDTTESDLQARMFAPGTGVPEDPATGGAAAALGGWLGHVDPTADGTLRRVIAQGLEMGRPSRLEIEVEKRAGKVAAVRVGGSAVLVSEGTIRVA